MKEGKPQRPLADQKIIEIAKKEVPEYGKKKCPDWDKGNCRKVEEPCNFSVCPLVRSFVGED